MKTPSNNKEKRKHLRTMLSLPLHFQANESGGIYPGLTFDASESGLLIQTLREIPVGIRIDIEVLFPKKLNLANIKAEAEIIWKKPVIGRMGKGINMELSSFRSQKKII